MKRLFGFLILFIFLLNACSKGDKNVTNILSSDTNTIINKEYADYGIDTTYLKAKFIQDIDTIKRFTAIKNGYLWFADYNTKSKQKLYEWQDVEKTDIALNVYCGYGNYQTTNLRMFKIQFFKKTENGVFVCLWFYTNPSIREGAISQCIVIENDKSLYRTSLDINKGYELQDWYGEDVLMISGEISSLLCTYTYQIYDKNWNCLFTVNDNNSTIDLKYVEGNNYIGPYMQCMDVNLLITPSEFVLANIATDTKNSIYVARYSLISKNQIWNQSIPTGFLIPSDTKVSYILQKQNNIWTYNYSFLFYDGTTKKISFSIDVNTGAIK